ncbi:MAG: bifunctional 23S rRNA (guanine(2069)-N(7))-methyltransferase RlmK/23S rRNA (guanine(2445)-N(2))-methyltransferase RlmL [Coriobacteriia bacterium]|nr:bifunctional 23S rRNA (guanine(2069)-N(7))-methyltransferase RlmK/23S rRNA (guanine(2445)-N(2))-methyltransferase RlmL [Coriobacteriia bacterium]
MFTLFATCARGVEPVLASELRSLGASGVREARAGVTFAGDLKVAYAACLWCRTASRVLLALGQVPADSVEALYEGVKAMPWEDHLSPDGTLAVDFATDSNPAFRNTMFGAQKVKDAVVDRLREKFGRRPSVDPAKPDLRINVRVRSNRATVSLDLTGDALHRRGYREPGTQPIAPLKESLAAGMLMLGGWPEIAKAGGVLLDPMCGSGTLLIEGAWIAGDVAPGSLRAYWGFAGWLGHDPDTWDDLLAAADDRAEAGIAALPQIVGFDSDPKAVELAEANLARAGLRGRVRVEKRGIHAATPPEGAAFGLVAVNPPYGERIGEFEEVRALYVALGERLRSEFGGWHYAVLAGDDSHAAALGSVPADTFRLFNGAIPVRLDVGDLGSAAAPDATAGVTAFANRLRKDLKHLGKWAKREGVRAWRVYDADLPDYSVAVDLYDCEDGVRRAVVFEYEAPSEIDPVKATVRLEQALSVIPEVLGVPAGEVRSKVRRRQKGEAQYERERYTGRFHEVREGDARFLVNLDDYLDTGLFPDHRTTRGMVAELAAGGSLLNLFCYTGAVTVRAALGGCVRSVSVDLSNTYVDWARRNLDLNGIDPAAHTLVRADVFRYLDDSVGADGPRFDVVFLDPPSFSTSKAMDATLDVQRDHVALVTKSAALLAPDGTLFFSTNLRKFHIDAAALSSAGLTVEDVSAASIPPDFERNPRIHRCYIVRRDPAGTY